MSTTVRARVEFRNSAVAEIGASSVSALEEALVDLLVNLELAESLLSLHYDDVVEVDREVVLLVLYVQRSQSESMYHVRLTDGDGKWLATKASQIARGPHLVLGFYDELHDALAKVACNLRSERRARRREVGRG